MNAQLNELAVMDETGDTKTMWDKNNPDEVKQAEKTFNKLKKKNYIAYNVTKTGKKGEIMHTFDPKAEKVIMVPPVVGG